MSGSSVLMFHFVGVMPWDNPYDTPDIAQSARETASIFTNRIGPIILNATALRVALSTNDTFVDASAWVVGAGSDSGSILVLAANLRKESATLVSVDYGTLNATMGHFAVANLETLFGSNGVVQRNGEQSSALDMALGAGSAGGYVMDFNRVSAGKGSSGGGVNGTDSSDSGAWMQPSASWVAMIAVTGAFTCFATML
jgi:hypothetical protein